MANDKFKTGDIVYSPNARRRDRSHRDPVMCSVLQLKVLGSTEEGYHTVTTEFMCGEVWIHVKENTLFASRKEAFELFEKEILEGEQKEIDEAKAFTSKVLDEERKRIESGR
jgi:hypothetical protein